MPDQNGDAPNAPVEPDADRGGELPEGASSDGGETAEGEAPRPQGEEAAESVLVLDHLGIDLISVSAGRPSLANGELWTPELTKVKEILERREHHAAILVGPDGVGKRAKRCFAMANPAVQPMSLPL